MGRVTRILLLASLIAAASGCTLSFGEAEEVALPEFSGAPVVRIAAPLSNTTYLAGVGVNVQVQVSAAGPDINRVEIFVDDTVVGTLPQPNPSGAASFGVTQTFAAEGEGVHVIRAVVYRETGQSGESNSVTVNVVDALPSPSATTPEPSITPLAASPTNTVAATATAGATATQPGGAPTSPGLILPTTNPSAPSSTPAQQGSPAPAPIARFEGIVNVRSGPSTNFEPPLGTFQAGQQTEILAVYTDGTWYKVRFGTGEGWVFAQIVQTEGDLSTLPRESGPPIPTARPRTSTPVPPAATQPPSQPTTPPATGDGPNLVVVNWEMRLLEGNRPVNEIAVNKPAIAFVRVRNAGNQPSGGFFAVLTIVNTADAGAKIVEAGSSGELQPGQEVVIQVGFTDTGTAGTNRTAAIDLDPNNQVPEANEGDNGSQPISYNLAAN